jgi:hypothetical protein
MDPHTADGRCNRRALSFEDQRQLMSGGSIGRKATMAKITGVGESAWIMDPDGNKVELWEPKVWDDKNKGA